MNSGEKPEITTEWVLDKFGILIVTGVTYLLVFQHESSYCRRFNIPTQLIRPDTTTVLYFAIIAISLGSTVVYSIDSLYLSKEANDEKHGFFHFLNVYALFIIALLFLLGRYHGDIWQIRFDLLFGMIFVLADILGAKLDQSEKSFVKRLKGPLHWITAPGSIWYIIRTRFGDKLFKFAIMIAVAYRIAFCIGDSTALTQTHFLVPSTNTNSVVVRFYGDTAICVGLVSNTNQLSGEIFIIPTTSDRHVVFEEKKIGPIAFK
jgi:hypothetical protein